MPTSWSPDGRFLVFNQAAGPGGGWDIFVLELAQEGEPQPVVSTVARECCAVFSPDGKWIAYVSNESGFDQVYIRPYPGDVKFLVSGSEEAAGEPVWSLNGREIFYRSGPKMMAVPVETQPTVRTGRPQVLFEGDYRGVSSRPPGYQYYDISPDGQRFVMIKESGQQEGQIHVILNWFEELKRLVPTE
jgi:Tol biopolymer transport system component